MTEDALFERVRAACSVRGAASLGIMGGTFDPVHLGHTALADAAMDELGLDAMLYIPAGNPSFKQGRDLASAGERLQMVRLAIAGRPGSAASSIEVDRPGITYTVDTLRAVRDRAGAHVRLVFVMGADALEMLPCWHAAPDLPALAEVAVAARRGVDVARACAALEQTGLGFTVRPLRRAVPDVSSTLVRARLARGLSTAGLLDPAVANYIERRGLYRADDALQGR